MKLYFKGREIDLDRKDKFFTNNKSIDLIRDSLTKHNIDLFNCKIWHFKDERDESFWACKDEKSGVLSKDNNRGHRDVGFFSDGLSIAFNDSKKSIAFNDSKKWWKRLDISEENEILEELF